MNVYLPPPELELNSSELLHSLDDNGRRHATHSTHRDQAAAKVASLKFIKYRPDQDRASCIQSALDHAASAGHSYACSSGSSLGI